MRSPTLLVFGLFSRLSTAWVGHSTTTFSGFDVFVGHGHYIDSTFVGFASNGTDWLMHDHYDLEAPNVPVTITRSGGGTFTFSSIDSSEWVQNLGVGGHTLTLTGHVQGGGVLVANFLTDNVFGFQTFSVGAWVNLVSLDIIGSSSNQGNCAGRAPCAALWATTTSSWTPPRCPSPGRWASSALA